MADDAPQPKPGAAFQAQMKGAVRSLTVLERALPLSAAEREGVVALDGRRALPLQITPHYLSLIDVAADDDPLRRQVVPRAEEWTDDDTFARGDPLGETELEVVPHLVHRYPDRVLFLVTDRCAAYCRFCTRKRMVGQGPTPTLDDLERAFAYIEQTPAIREVILSGGDALTLSDDKLDRVLGRLRAIDHVEILRIATRTPAFAPQRVTDALLDVVRRHHPVYFLVHFNHPRELEGEAAAAVERLADAGVPVLNQTVLLRGVNDDVATLEALFRKLTRLRARPYYLHQCDLAEGTAHFRVPLEEALALVAQLRGRVSGLSVPTFVVDIPGGKGKVALGPDPVVLREPGRLLLRGFDGGEAWYPLS
jgi:lysine 2,3-aminomutase